MCKKILRLSTLQQIFYNKFLVFDPAKNIWLCKELTSSVGSYGFSFSFTPIRISTKETLVHVKRVFSHFPIKGNFFLEDLKELPDNCGAPALTEWKNQSSIFKEKRYLWYQSLLKIHVYFSRNLWYIFWGMQEALIVQDLVYYFHVWISLFLVIGAFHLVHVMSWFTRTSTRVIAVETGEMDRCYLFMPIWTVQTDCIWFYFLEFKDNLKVVFWGDERFKDTSSVCVDT